MPIFARFFLGDAQTEKALFFFVSQSLFGSVSDGSTSRLASPRLGIASLVVRAQQHGDRLDVRRVGEHVHRLDRAQPVPASGDGGAASVGTHGSRRYPRRFGRAVVWVLG